MQVLEILLISINLSFYFNLIAVQLFLLLLPDQHFLLKLVQSTKDFCRRRCYSLIVASETWVSSTEWSIYEYLVDRCCSLVCLICCAYRPMIFFYLSLPIKLTLRRLVHQQTSSPNFDFIYFIWHGVHGRNGLKLRNFITRFKDYIVQEYIFFTLRSQMMTNQNQKQLLILIVINSFIVRIV